MHLTPRIHLYHVNEECMQSPSAASGAARTRVTRGEYDVPNMVGGRHLHESYCVTSWFVLELGAMEADLVAPIILRICSARP